MCNTGEDRFKGWKSLRTASVVCSAKLSEAKENQALDLLELRRVWDDVGTERRTNKLVFQNRYCQIEIMKLGSATKASLMGGVDELGDGD